MGSRLRLELAGGHLAGHQLLLEHVKQLDALPVLDGRNEENVLFNISFLVYMASVIWYKTIQK